MLIQQIFFFNCVYLEKLFTDSVVDSKTKGNMKSKLPLIIKLAKITRQELEPFIMNHRASFDKDWGCSCLVCSWVLHRVLKKFGIQAKLCDGKYDSYYHAFILVDNIVVDISATQFGKDSVVVEDFNNSKYSIDKQFNLPLYKHFQYWPDEQQPHTYSGKLNRIIQNIVRKKFS